MSSNPNARGIYEKVSGSGDWWIRYADSSGKIRREKAGTKANARNLYQRRKAEALQGKKLPELRRKPIAFATVAQDALEYSRQHKQSADKDRERMKLVLEWFGDTAAESITPQIIKRRLLAEQQQRDWKPATVNRYKALLSLVFRVAVESGKLPENPVRLVRRLREDNGVIRFLKPDEERTLQAAVEPKHPERWSAIAFAIHTGMRAGEQRGLEWSDIALDANPPHVRLARTKNGSMRYIPLDKTAINALHQLRNSTAGDTPEKVFPQQPYRMWFDLALKASGIKDFTWHCLRHTFASRLIMSGVDLRTVAELMGHKSLQMTMRYAHLAPEHNAAAISKLDSFIEATSTRTDTEENRGNSILERAKQVAVGQ